MKVRKVTKIEKRPSSFLQPVDLHPEKKKRVAAYARVSTEMDEQLNSYEAQIDYYTKHIKANNEWDFVKVYTDEGISGLMTAKREGFQSMVEDAICGKIDLILTKSVSRFARNTVDTLTTVRKLKEKGVEVYFEKENIWTMDSKGELLITIMSSLAQEESRSLSENVTWGQRKRFSDGKVLIAYKNFLGYREGANGHPEIVPEEAEIIKRIYREFLFGNTYAGIAKGLSDDGIKTPRGKDVWQASTVKSILQNEKYKVDALLQKSFTVDFLTKKRKANEGEIPQYYVENSHAAIISDEVFDMVQHEIENRKGKRNYGSSVNFFSGRIFCACCGEPFTRKVWHSTTKYKRYIWQCGKKYAKVEPCSTPHLTEDEIKEAFNKMLANLIHEKTGIISICTITINEVLDTSREQEQASVLEAKLAEMYSSLSAKIKALGMETGDSQAEQQMYESELALYENKQEELSRLKELIADKEKRRFNCESFLDSIHKLDNLCIEFSEGLWLSLVDHVVIMDSDLTEVEFHLRNGQALTIEA